MANNLLSDIECLFNLIIELQYEKCNKFTNNPLYNPNMSKLVHIKENDVIQKAILKYVQLIKYSKQTHPETHLKFMENSHK